MNKLYFGDNLSILRDMKDQSIDLIYLDPPFNTNRVHQGKGKTQHISFTDIFDELNQNEYDNLSSDLKELISFANKFHSKEMGSFLSFIAVRVNELHRILKKDGCTWFHCNQKSDYYIRILLDIIFGNTNFRNKVVWQYNAISCYPTGGFTQACDYLYVFGKKDFKFNTDQTFIPLNNEQLKKFKHKDEKGYYRWSNFGTLARTNAYSYTILGVTDSFTMSENTAKKLEREGSLQKRGKTILYKSYLDESKGCKLMNVWTDIRKLRANYKEIGDYPTSKPIKLLDRIIKASSKQNDVVLDPFCGGGSTLLSAHKLNRNWIGIDQNPDSIDFIQKCFDIEQEQAPLFPIEYEVIR